MRPVGTSGGGHPKAAYQPPSIIAALPVGATYPGGVIN